ncbi:MAG: hypothetical protein JO121_21960 [Deltaproteobacteria bacterium]|nr:hypothetical protein [Deltaproteobacteria bacterium]
MAALPHLVDPRGSPFTSALAVLLALALCGSARAASLLDGGPIDYTIMSRDGRSVLGHGRYTIDREKDAIVLSGESRYDSGEYDVETATLSPGFSGTLPSLEKFDRTFYSAAGTLTRAAHADLTTAYASCTQAGANPEPAQTLDFPSDTWAGASVLVPIQRFLQSGGEGNCSLNVFNCTSKPGIYAVTVTVASQASGWPWSPTDAVQVEVKPHFGWFDVFIEPWVPKLNAWFDPGTGWSFQGVAIARYYKGPEVLIVAGNSKSGRAVR